MNSVLGRTGDWILARLVPRAKASAMPVEWRGCCDWKICWFCYSDNSRCWCAGCDGPRCA